MADKRIAGQSNARASVRSACDGALEMPPDGQLQIDFGEGLVRMPSAWANGKYRGVCARSQFRKSAGH